MFSHVASIALLQLSSCASSATDTTTLHYGLENLAKIIREDVRVIAMGDSYTTPLWMRVPLASIRTWPIPKVTAICGSAPQNGQFIRALAECSPVESLAWIDDEKYRIMRSTSTDNYFALPVRTIREVYTNSKFQPNTSDWLFQFRFDDSSMQSSPAGEFANQSDQLKFRLLYWQSEEHEQSVQKIKIKDLNTTIATLDLHQEARCLWHLNENPETQTRVSVPLQINASGYDFTISNDVANLLRVRIAENESLTGTNKYFHPAGSVYYHTDEENKPEDGFYYSYMADDGWTLEGHGCNQIPIDELHKAYSEEQFTHWLDVTTLDRDQHVLFYWYFNVEWLHHDDVKVAMENMIAQANRCTEDIGISSWSHLLVMPHMIKFGVLGNSPEAHEWMGETRDAMLEIAMEQTNVAFASIYDATEGILFDGSDEGVNWLVNNGFDSFECGENIYDLANGPLEGDLLDAANLHPWGDESGMFFASILGNLIRESGCIGDLVTDGTIDIHDLLIIIQNFGGNEQGDINDDQIVNLLDLLLLVQNWGECWPVQAPFSEPIR